jgi:hypothetical protein
MAKKKTKNFKSTLEDIMEELSDLILNGFQINTKEDFSNMEEELENEIETLKDELFELVRSKADALPSIEDEDLNDGIDYSELEEESEEED